MVYILSENFASLIFMEMQREAEMRFCYELEMGENGRTVLLNYPKIFMRRLNQLFTLFEFPTVVYTLLSTTNKGNEF